MTGSASRRILAVFLIAFAWINGSAQGEASSSDSAAFLGEVRDQLYVNSYFGFEIRLPHGWQPVDADDKKRANEIVLELLRKSGSTYIPRKYDSVSLIYLRKEKIGASRNALFRIMATKQPNASITPAMVAAASRQKVIEDPFSDSVGEVRKVLHGNRQFAMFDYRVKSPTERAIKSRYLSTTSRGYSIGFVLTFVEDKDERLLTEVINSLLFK